jgi:hypothetical protein
MRYKLGKLAARFPAQLPKLRDRLVAPLPPPPATPFGYGLTDAFPMALNNTIGDCTIAGKVHCDQIVATILGQTYTYPGDAAVQSAYFGLTGGGDTGLDLATVIQAWSSPSGLLGSQIIAAASIDVSDYELLQQAIYSFGFLYVGVQLPTTADTEFPGVWHTVATGQPIEGGHCIILNGSKTVDLGGEIGVRPALDLVTWGAETACTQGWWGDFGDEAWVVVPAAYETANHNALQSLDLAQMKADVAALQAAT